MKHGHVFLCALVVAGVLSLTACRALPAPSPTTRLASPAVSPGRPHTRAPAVLLFFHQQGQMRSRCLTPSAATSDQERFSDRPQPVAPPVDGVVRVCALRVKALVSYESFEDTRVRASVSASALGGISLDVAAGRCATSQQAVGVASFTVTDVWFSPFFGGKVLGPPMPSHPLERQTCLPGGEALILWAGVPPTRYCFVGLGTLHLSRPLRGVSRICSGGARGSAFFHAMLISGIGVDLDPHACVSIPLLLHEPAISVDTVSIEAPVVES